MDGMTLWDDIVWAARGRIKWGRIWARLWCELGTHYDFDTGYGFDQCARCRSNAPIPPNMRRGWIP